MRKQRKSNFELFRNSSKTLIILFFTCCSSLVFSQPTLDWVKTLGGTSYDYGNAIELDQNGNIYVTGYFSGAADFDPGTNVYNLTASGGMDAYLCKLDPVGNFLWAFKIGGATPSSSYNDNGNDLAIDTQGNVIITGAFTGNTDFDPSANNFIVNSVGYNDIFIAKYNTNGGLVWAKTLGGPYGELSTSVDVDGVNNIYLTGNFGGTLDFDPGPNSYNLTTPNTCSSIYHLKLDQNGFFIWANQTGTFSTNEGYSQNDFQGNVFSTGRFFNTVDFDPGTNTVTLSTSSTGPNAFVRKLDQNGNFLWVRHISGFYSEGKSIITDNLGNVYVCGFCNGIVDFNPGSGNYVFNTTNDGFILKYNSNGDFQWVKIIGNQSSNEAFLSLELDDNNNVYALGVTDGLLSSIDIDPSLNVQLLSGNQGSFLLKLSSTGSFLNGITPQTGFLSFFDTYTSDTYSGGFCLKYNNSSIFLTGTFSQTVDFNPSTQTYAVSAVGNSSPTDIFIQKLNTCTSSSNIINPSVCESYTAPDGQIYTQSGQYNSTLTNSTGCDSVITINLTIQQSITSSITENACEEYTAPDGQVYTQSGLYTATIQTAAGCDSIITINLTLQTIDTVVTRIGNTLTAIQNGATYQWINCATNQPINGATSQSYTATSPGWYAVLVTVNGCTEQSSCRQIKKLILPNPPLNGNASVDEEDLLEFRIYPNPTRDAVFIEFAAETTDDYVLMDASGRKVQMGTLKGKTTSISLKDLSSGTYMLQIGADHVPIRLVKE